MELLSLALEGEGESDVTHEKRLYMGRHEYYSGAGVPESAWFWDAENAAEQAAIDAFWDSYHVAAVEILSDSCPDLDTPDLCPTMVAIGTETDFLFRTDAYWTDDLRELVDLARGALPSSTALTYDMRIDGVTDPLSYSGSAELWKDLELDFIGVSGYFPLTSGLEADGPHTSCYYRDRHLDVMQEHILDLRERNGLLPVLYTEFGYPDLVSAPSSPTTTAGVPDYGSTAGLDSSLHDGEETQGNILQGFYEQREACNDVVAGTFLWDNPVSLDTEWSDFKLGVASHGVRRWYNADFGLTHDYSQRVVSAYYDPDVWEGGPGTSASPPSYGAGDGGSGSGPHDTGPGPDGHDSGAPDSGDAADSGAGGTDSAPPADSGLPPDTGA